MCDLKSKSTLEKVTVYKICIKCEGRYFAYFSGMEVTTGLVANMERMAVVEGHRFGSYKKDRKIYNELAVGRTSGFKSKQVAGNLSHAFGRTKLDVVVLEMEIVGGIVRGTGAKILHDYDTLNKSIVYAGERVISFKEINVMPLKAEIEKINEARRVRQARLYQHLADRREVRRKEKRETVMSI